jgi:hypothetical protein
MIDSTGSRALITTASAERVLISVVYHYVLAQSPSPEEAANTDAIRAGAPKFGFKPNPKIATLATKGMS